MRGLISYHKGIVSLLACGCFCCPQLAAQAQAPSQRSEWFSAENHWRLTAINISSESDTVTPALRAKRNAYLRPLLEVTRERREPSGLPSGTGTSWDSGPATGEAPELAASAHAVWVVAKFESFHVFAIDAQHQLIYTEMNFRITDVIRQPSSASLATGSDLDCETPGGRIREPNGSATSFPIIPERHYFQPSGTYLMVGTYDSETEYFHLDNWWNVTSGKVVPETGIEMNRAANGNSKLSGLTITQAIQYLDSTLPSSD